MIQDIYPHLFSNTFDSISNIQENDYIFHFKGNSLLLKETNEGLEIPRKEELKECPSEGTFLFTFNNIKCFLIEEDPKPTNHPFIYHETNPRSLKSQKEIDWCSTVALQLKNWYANNKFCGTCGTPTAQKNNERAVFCPSCKTTKYPSISPAIIVAIRHKGKILLARNSQFPEGLYSLVAGYVEIGETIEDAVQREVKEEVGIKIKNIRYYKSQPWPFSGSIMIGFIAEADDSQTICIDNDEIIEAAWYSPENLPNYPSDRSIAGEIINKFRNNTL